MISVLTQKREGYLDLCTNSRQESRVHALKQWQFLDQFEVQCILNLQLQVSR